MMSQRLLKFLIWKKKRDSTKFLEMKSLIKLKKKFQMKKINDKINS